MSTEGSMTGTESVVTWLQSYSSKNWGQEGSVCL